MRPSVLVALNQAQCLAWNVVENFVPASSADHRTGAQLICVHSLSLVALNFESHLCSLISLNILDWFPSAVYQQSSQSIKTCRHLMTYVTASDVCWGMYTDHEQNDLECAAVLGKRPWLSQSNEIWVSIKERLNNCVFAQFIFHFHSHGVSFLQFAHQSSKKRKRETKSQCGNTSSDNG